MKLNLLEVTKQNRDSVGESLNSNRSGKAMFENFKDMIKADNKRALNQQSGGQKYKETTKSKYYYNKPDDSRYADDSFVSSKNQNYDKTHAVNKIIAQDMVNFFTEDISENQKPMDQKLKNKVNKEDKSNFVADANTYDSPRNQNRSDSYKSGDNELKSSKKKSKYLESMKKKKREVIEEVEATKYDRKSALNRLLKLGRK